MNGEFHGMHEFGHWTAFGVAVAVFLINVFMNIENNDSRLGGIPKGVYAVLTGIMNSTTGEQGYRSARDASSETTFWMPRMVHLLIARAVPARKR